MAAHQTSSPTTLITGATSGIGAAFARALAAKGHHLIVTGRRAAELERVAADIRERFSVDVETLIIELSNPVEVERLCDLAVMRDVDTLVNNAGHGGEARYCELPFEDQARMVGVHVLATMRLISALAPRMIDAGHGTIINVSSLAGFVSAPRSAVYCGTKSFLINFSESLHMELAPSGIRVQVLCPGFTRTHFQTRLGIDASRLRNRGIIRWMSAQDVVRASMRAIVRGTVICVPGFWNKVCRRLAGLIPRRLYYAAAASRRNT